MSETDEPRRISIKAGELKIAQPEYGENVTLGMVNGQALTVCRPLNAAAVTQMVNEGGTAILAALALHDRIEALEKKLRDK